VKEKFLDQNGVKLTYMPFFMKAVTAALKEYPLVNASLDGEDVVYHRDVNLGVAVALDWGLVVPVVKGADDLSIVGLQKAVTDVAEPFEMSLAAVSKHLGILTRAGLISQERRGRVVWCKLEPDALRDASIWMQSFGQFEAVHLDAFEQFLAKEFRDDG